MGKHEEMSRLHQPFYNENNDSSLTDRLRELIGDQSVLAFAKKCSVNESSIRHVLNGGAPKLSLLKQISEATDVNIQWLATGDFFKYRKDLMDIVNEDPSMMSLVEHSMHGQYLNPPDGVEDDYVFIKALGLDEYPQPNTLLDEFSPSVNFQFNKRWLIAHLGVSEPDRHVRIAIANSNAMSPIVQSGDTLLIDTDVAFNKGADECNLDKARGRSGSIFLANVTGKTELVVLHFRPGGKVIIASGYGSTSNHYEVSISDFTADCSIYGYVIWKDSVRIRLDLPGSKTS